MKIIFKLGYLVSIALLFALTNFGITMAADAKATLDTGDTAWMLTSTVIVLMMTIPGVAHFLRRHGSKEKRPCNTDAKLRHYLSRYNYLDGCRI